MIAQGVTLFFDAKYLGEIPTGSPTTGHPIEVGQVQISDFRPIYRYISETMQYIHTYKQTNKFI